MRTEEAAGPVAGGTRTPRPRTADFEYELPAELVARYPVARRDEARMLVLDRSDGSLADRHVSDLPSEIAAGDALVLNDTRVFPARLRGRKPTGAGAEILLLRPAGGDPAALRWHALVRPGGKLKPGRVVEVADDLRVHIEDSDAAGGRIVRLEGPGGGWALVERHGDVPLPPYIDRPPEAVDRRRYQTVYAERTGSVAAPTAGLHFTPALLERLQAAGARIVRITLHVGVGTFRPVEAERPADHRLHPEWYEVSREAARSLDRTRAEGARVWAVGTTSARTLETVVGPDGRFRAGSGWTELYIHPPFRFRAVDGLLTNFHLPRSSLLMLVAAFAGLPETLGAYRHAVRRRYRFYSYGDAMLIR